MKKGLSIYTNIQKWHCNFVLLEIRDTGHRLSVFRGITVIISLTILCYAMVCHFNDMLAEFRAVKFACFAIKKTEITGPMI